jgi:exopolysaccharide biosynthesis protein
MKKLSKFLSKVTKFIRATIKFVAIQVVILVIGFMPYIISETVLEYRFHQIQQTH